MPRISAYSASSADGNAAPVRTIEGPKTLQARTSHYLAVDSIHDELLGTNPFADAILTWRGGVNGNEAPIRIIQGPKTLLNAPDNVAVDAIHGEVYTASFTTDSIFVYKRLPGGNEAPIRILHGPDTQLDRPIRVDVDPINNLIGVVCDHYILFFNRTDNGDTPPKWSLGGPKLFIGTRSGTRDVRMIPQSKRFVVLATWRPNGPPPEQARGRGAGGNAEFGGFGGQGFGGRNGGQRMIGIWKYGDTGDTPPWAALYNNSTTKIQGSRLAINPKGGDLIVGGDGQIQIYHVPEIFEKESQVHPAPTVTSPLTRRN